MAVSAIANEDEICCACANQCSETRWNIQSITDLQVHLLISWIILQICAAHKLIQAATL